MAQQTINVGTAPNDGTGTPLRTAFQYTNSNFSELYTALGGGSGLPGASNQVIFNDGGTNLAGDAGLVFNKTTDTLGTGRLTTSGDAIVCSSTGDFYVGTTLSPQFKVERATGAATISGDLTVKTNVLKVDTTNNRVGINTSPAQALDVASGNLQVRTGGTIYSDTFSNYGAALQINAAGSLPLRLQIGGSNAYEITSGNVHTWQNVGGVAGTAMTLNSTGLGVGAVPSNYRLYVSAAFSSGLNGAYIECGEFNKKSLIVNHTNASVAVNLFEVQKTGTAQFLVDSSGNVGIGVTPSANGEKLNANGTIISTNQSIGGFALNQAGFDYSTSTKNLRIFSGTSNATGSSMSFVVGTSTSFLTALTLNSLGDFGVGITSPSYRLHSIVASGADKNIFAAQVSGASNGFEVKWNHATTTLRVIVSNLPTSSAGLASGTLWIDTAAGNTLKVA